MTLKEYVPVEVDLTDVVEPVLAMRPDNTRLDIILDVKSVLDISHNSVQYQYAWEMWQNYSEMLEDLVLEIRDTFSPKKETV